jgi:hypothetical protein
MRSGKRRGGFSLLDPLAAIAMLGIAGSAMVLHLAETRAAMERVRTVEVRTDEAAAILARVAREPRALLMQQVGRRRLGAHELRISFVTPSLASIEVVEPGTGAITARTIVFRPAEDPNGR